MELRTPTNIRLKLENNIQEKTKPRNLKHLEAGFHQNPQIDGISGSRSAGCVAAAVSTNAQSLPQLADEMVRYRLVNFGALNSPLSKYLGPEGRTHILEA